MIRNYIKVKDKDLYHFKMKRILKRKGKLSKINTILMRLYCSPHITLSLVFSTEYMPQPAHNTESRNGHAFVVECRSIV